MKIENSIQLTNYTAIWVYSIIWTSKWKSEIYVTIHSHPFSIYENMHQISVLYLVLFGLRCHFAYQNSQDHGLSISISPRCFFHTSLVSTFSSSKPWLPFSSMCPPLVSPVLYFTWLPPTCCLLIAVFKKRRKLGVDVVGRKRRRIHNGREWSRSMLFWCVFSYSEFWRSSWKCSSPPLDYR